MRSNGHLFGFSSSGFLEVLSIVVSYVPKSISDYLDLFDFLDYVIEGVLLDDLNVNMENESITRKCVIRKNCVLKLNPGSILFLDFSAMSCFSTFPLRNASQKIKKAVVPDG